MRIRTFPALAMALALTAAACGGGNATQAPAGSVAPGSQAPSSAAPGGATTQVSIVDSAFNPATINIAVGGEVNWTNTGDLPHTVTFADDGPASGNLSTDQAFPATFDEAGTFTYVCSIHSQMQGTVNVGQ